MTVIQDPSDSHRVDSYPSRFRAAEKRSRRLGRVVRVAGKVRHLDEQLMARIGRALSEVDEVGAAIAAAMRLPAGTPGRVSRRQLDAVLADGSIPQDAPAALADFVRHLEDTPHWVDWQQIARGQQVYLRFGQNVADVLLQLSLIGGYRFGGPSDLLAATGGLTGDSALRRLAETQHWTMSLTTPGGLQPHGEAWRLTAQVRVIHAMINKTYTSRWDTRTWGMPINQADLAATLGLFDATVLLGVRVLGVPLTTQESRDVMHMWKYIGWLLGVPEDFLVDSERQRHALNYHLLLAQGDITEAGPKLSQAIVQAQQRRHYRRAPAVRGRYEQERLLSMLSAFLGRHSMRELGLPWRPPWGHAYVIVLNTWRYRTPWGRRRLRDWGLRVQERTRREYFGPSRPDITNINTST